jgi:pimeloyl-ACP methyl ester carboxylesterase
MIATPDEKIRIDVGQGITLVGDYYDSPSDKGIILFPGFTEHRFSLGETAKILTPEFKTWVFDINSQGESSGDWNLKEMEKSVYEAQKHVKDRYALSKIGALGNSVGGMAVGVAVANRDSNLDCICLLSTPAGLQDFAHPVMLAALGLIPQPVIRMITIAYDKFESLVNENYKNKTHAQFSTEKGYRPYAQFGALKIPNIKDFVGWISQAPRLDAVADKINKPTLMVYGGEAGFFGIKHGVLPQNIIEMYASIATRDKELVIVEGADHSLNGHTRIDDCFNQDQNYQFVKEEIFNHFSHFML